MGLPLFLLVNFEIFCLEGGVGAVCGKTISTVSLISCISFDDTTFLSKKYKKDFHVNLINIY
jgi:hypothetical protein